MPGEDHQSLAGTTIVVTGGTSGIGEAAVDAFTKRGARVILTGRSRERGERVAERTGATFEAVDFADLDSVRDLASRLKDSLESLDVLVNNAGVFLTKRAEALPGVEATFVINHLAPFVLTSRLMPLLEASGAARIVNTASEMHWKGRLDLDDLALAKGYASGVNAYARSKLANILFTRSLAMRLDPDRITVNAIHPGVVQSKLGSGNRGVTAVVWNVLKRWYGHSNEQGADTLVWAATDPTLKGVTGHYFAKRKEYRWSEAAGDDALADALWTRSEKLTGEAWASPRWTATAPSSESPRP